jgi:two-component system response regulator HydG
MMKDVLVISNHPDTTVLVKRSVSEHVVVHETADLTTAGAISNAQFDIIFLDVAVLPEDSSGAIHEIFKQFGKANAMVQFVVLAPKQMIRHAVDAVRQGAASYLTYPITGDEIRLAVETAQNHVSTDLELGYLRDKFWKSDWLDIIKTANPLMREVFKELRSVAPTIATVLLLGETGTGKGLMARLIHRHSHRSDGPFVSVHCGAIPDTLIESELFGHEKGAFTGAHRRKIGKFEMARNGTIFLDEIGTVTTTAQIKLLQVLQDGTFSRVGGEELMQTDARIIAATNANLNEMAAAGRFRKDLLYRINIFPLQLPALRERLEDLPHLVDLFLATLDKKYAKAIHGIRPGVMECLRNYDWPGNLRELENILERAYILETEDMLRPDCLPAALIPDSNRVMAFENQEALPLAEARQMAIDEFERSYLANLLNKNRGKISASAQAAGITTRQFSRLAAKHGLDKSTYKH